MELPKVLVTLLENLKEDNYVSSWKYSSGKRMTLTINFEPYGSHDEDRHTSSQKQCFTYRRKPPSQIKRDRKRSELWSRKEKSDIDSNYVTFENGSMDNKTDDYMDISNIYECHVNPVMHSSTPHCSFLRSGQQEWKPSKLENKLDHIYELNYASEINSAEFETIEHLESYVSNEVIESINPIIECEQVVIKEQLLMNTEIMVQHPVEMKIHTNVIAPIIFKTLTPDDELYYFLCNTCGFEYDECGGMYSCTKCLESGIAFDCCEHCYHEFVHFEHYQHLEFESIELPT